MDSKTRREVAVSTTIGIEARVRERWIESAMGEPSAADRAFAARLEALRPLLARAAGAILRRADDVDDAVQDALLRMVRSARQFDARRGTLEAWAREIARNVALDMLQRLQPASLKDPGAAPAPPQSPPLEAEEIRGRLRKAVDALPDPQRCAFLLVHQEGLSHEATARALSISLETLRARLYRARQNLRSSLKEYAP